MHMELPVGTEGRNATLDFLSLYSPSSAHAQHDPAPPPGAHLKTQDFLQPLEWDGKHDTSTIEGSRCGGMAAAKPPMPSPPVSGEHLNSISYFHQRVSKPERSLFTTSQACSTTQTDANSNCSSYTGSGFTLWDGSDNKKGKTRKENVSTERHAMRGVTVMASLLDRPPPSPPSSFHKPNPTTFSSFSSSQLSSSQNDQSFMDMITSAKNEEEEDDDEDKFNIKKGFSSHPKGSLSVKVESKPVDQKPTTPRSKHSATEQRRRSKINDRFQKLREVIPNSDQKRDKASFLLQVVEYIQLLQEKVNRYESSYNTWSPESPNMIQWRNCHPYEGFINHTRGVKTETDSVKLVSARFDKNKASNLKERGEQAGLAFHPAMQQRCMFSFGEASPAASSPVPQEPVSIDSGTINISSTTYSQGLLNTLTKALHSSGVDLSHACISVKINLRKGACDAIPHSLAAKDIQIPAPLPHFKAASPAQDFSRALKRLRTS